MTISIYQYHVNRICFLFLESKLVSLLALQLSSGISKFWNYDLVQSHHVLSWFNLELPSLPHESGPVRSYASIIIWGTTLVSYGTNDHGCLGVTVSDCSHASKNSIVYRREKNIQIYQFVLKFFKLLSSLLRIANNTMYAQSHTCGIASHRMDTKMRENSYTADRVRCRHT